MNVLSLQDLDLPDLSLPTLSPAPSASPDTGSGTGSDKGPNTKPSPGADSDLGDFFRQPEHAIDSPWVGCIAQQSPLIDGLRSLFHGPASLVRLRLWMFMTLSEQNTAVLSRPEIDPLWQALRPDAMGAVETVLQRFRDTGLLTWDESRQQGTLTPLARQLANMLKPLAGACDAAPAS